MSETRPEGTLIKRGKARVEAILSESEESERSKERESKVQWKESGRERMPGVRSSGETEVETCANRARSRGDGSKQVHATSVIELSLSLAFAR